MAKSLPRSRRKDDLPEGLWRPEPEEAWWRRWLRGWRLGVVVAGVMGAIGMWRGAGDYQAFKAWRGRVCAEEAVLAATAGRSDEAQRLLDRAGTLAPQDPVVLRTIADFAERRSDMMALYALRQLQATGQASEDDLLRQARLAFQWGQPGLAPEAAVRRWAEAPVESLGVGPLEIGARWLALRGMEAPAEQRMRRAMELAAERGEMGEARRLNLALAQLLASPASGPPGGDRLREAITRWLDVGRDAGAKAGEIAEAMTRAVAAVAGGGEATNGEATGGWREGAMADLRAVLAYRMDTAPASSRLALRLAHVELELLAVPTEREAVAKDLSIRAQSYASVEALVVARWLMGRGFFDDALDLAGVQEPRGQDRAEWRAMQLEARVEKRDWGAARQVLADSAAFLPEWNRRLWEYRIERASSPEAGPAPAVREALAASLRRAEGADALQAARGLESLGDRALALEVYRQWQRHERFGLPARVALVRCLHEQADDGAELIEALQSLLTLAPDLEEARGDLAYLRLLPPQEPRAEDLETARRLVTEAPRFLAYRVVAALAALREEKPEEAIALIGGDGVPWAQVPAGWRVVRASCLAANRRAEEARSLVQGIPVDRLRPGEVRLLEQFSLLKAP